MDANRSLQHTMAIQGSFVLLVVLVSHTLALSDINHESTCKSVCLSICQRLQNDCRDIDFFIHSEYKQICKTIEGCDPGCDAQCAGHVMGKQICKEHTYNTKSSCHDVTGSENNKHCDAMRENCTKTIEEMVRNPIFAQVEKYPLFGIHFVKKKKADITHGMHSKLQRTLTKIYDQARAKEIIKDHKEGLDKLVGSVQADVTKKFHDHLSLMAKTEHSKAHTSMDNKKEDDESKHFEHVARSVFLEDNDDEDKKAEKMLKPQTDEHVLLNVEDGVQKEKPTTTPKPINAIVNPDAGFGHAVPLEILLKEEEKLKNHL